MTCTNQLVTVKCYTLQTRQTSTLINLWKKININHDLSLIAQWLRSNKISLNADKTELVIFSPKRKQITKHLNFRISGQKIEISTRVKYLGIQIDQHLNWNEHIKNIIPKLSRAIGVLFKIRHNVPKFLLKTIYYSIFNSQFMLAKCGVKMKTAWKNYPLSKARQ